MKKKLLSLVLAGAMVASTSVSAFADDTTISSYKDGSNTANVTINGGVDANNGDSPSGTISVSIPTALSFSVKKNGEVKGGNITITNRGAETVDVTAVSFQDTTSRRNITVKSPTELNQGDDRSNIVLGIGGTKGGIAYFKSEDAGSNKNGIYDSEGQNQSLGIKVSTISGSASDTLTLTGYAGGAELSGDEDNKGITDTFILRLKVTKA